MLLARDLVRGDFGFGQRKKKKSTEMVILQLPNLWYNMICW